jgi:Asp/Glu/hydantoin racemase
MTPKTLALIHTVNWHGRLINTPLVDPWLARNPDVRVVNIVDDSLLTESLEHGGATPAVLKRLQLYFQAAEAMGADAAVCTCTTVGEAARIAREYLSIPVFNIDEPLAREAVRVGRRIGIVATVATSPAATQRQLERAAGEAGIEIETTVVVVRDAFDHLQNGRTAEHDRLVTAELDRLSTDVDVLVLGQISLAQIRHETRIPVLNVAESGLAEARRLLDMSP